MARSLARLLEVSVPHGGLGNQTLSYEGAESLVRRGTVRATGDDGASGVSFRHDRKARATRPRRARAGGRAPTVASVPQITGGSLTYHHEEQIIATMRALKCPVLYIEASNGWPWPKKQACTRMRQPDSLARA